MAKGWNYKQLLEKINNIYFPTFVQIILLARAHTHILSGRFFHNIFHLRMLFCVISYVI